MFRRSMPLLLLLGVLVTPATGRGESGVPACLGKPATIVAPAGGGQVRGTARADAIVTGAGSDVIFGGAGNDRICSGAGDDRIFGGIGSDPIDAGSGDDEVVGGNGSDPVLGGPGRDTVFGNRGNDDLDGGAGERDFVAAGLGDDTASGGAGDSDQVTGEVGNDQLFGGPGNGDTLRGDRGTDLFDGGPGSGDTASFAISGENGMIVDGRGIEANLQTGEAENDGRDRLTGIEDVIGTPFRDRIVGNGEANRIYGAAGNDELIASGPGDLAFGGAGSDTCEGFSAEDSCGREPLETQTRVEVDVAGDSTATTLTGVWRMREFDFEHPTFDSPEPIVPIQMTVGFAEGAWIVRESPLPLIAGDRCALVGAGEARCPIEGRPDAIFLDGGRGDDLIEVEPSVAVPALIRGELGADTLLGGGGDDSLQGEAVGDDVLMGRGGDDILSLGEVLEGGSGSDLLIANVCSEQVLSGGGGIDSVSFARVEGDRGVQARIGGTAVYGPYRTERLYLPPGCGRGAPAAAQIGEDVERIEGSPHDDVLIGNDRANTLLGRGGDDELHGKGDADLLVGGSGRDRLFGESGFDRLYFRDNLRDLGGDCGSGQGVAKADPGDPPAAHCRPID